MTSALFVKSADMLAQVALFYEQFSKSSFDNTIPHLLLLSVSSCGGNINKSIYGQDKSDFNNLLHVALKDIAEAIYYLNVLVRLNFFPYDYSYLLKMSDEIKDMLIASINAGKASSAVSKYDTYTSASSFSKN